MNRCDSYPKVVVLSESQTLRLLHEKHEIETHMAQARTLDDAQIKRVQRYLRTRHNHTRDSTIFTFAFNTVLRAKELAAPCVGGAYDAEGTVRDAFVLQRSQTKGARTRTVYINRTLRVSPWSSTAPPFSVLFRQHPCLRAAKADTLVQTPCASCFLVYLQTVDCVVQPHTPHVAHLSPNLPTKALAYAC